MDPLTWLLGGDPAIGWQAMRDLTEASPAAVAQQRARVPREGLGAAILAQQQLDGSWRKAGIPVWASTLFTLLLLRATGIDPEEAAMAIERLETHLAFSDADGYWELRSRENEERSFFAGEEEPCINGGVLAVGGSFGRPWKNLAERLLGEQLEDCGWNCEAPKSRRSSFHTTICVLEGLLAYERAVGSAPAVTAARLRGEEYLLARTLFRRQSTGEVAHEDFLQLAFPPRYRYDVLRALDYFRDGHPEGLPEARLEEALNYVEGRRQPDGRWLLGANHGEILPLSTGEQPGSPSRWNTLRALRVLRWARR